MDIVIDIQGYKGFRGRFIAKEIAILRLDSNIVGHWVLYPTKSLKFPNQYKKEYHWVITHAHKLKWNQGKSNFKKIMTYIREIVHKSDRVYVRGKSKSDFIDHYTGKQPINLEDEEECPSFSQLELESTMCDYHTETERLQTTARSYCALMQAYQLRKWIQENSSIESWFNM